MIKVPEVSSALLWFKNVLTPQVVDSESGLYTIDRSEASLDELSSLPALTDDRKFLNSLIRDESGVSTAKLLTQDALVLCRQFKILERVEEQLKLKNGTEFLIGADPHEPNSSIRTLFLVESNSPFQKLYRLDFDRSLERKGNVDRNNLVAIERKNVGDPPVSIRYEIAENQIHIKDKDQVGTKTILLPEPS